MDRRQFMKELRIGLSDTFREAVTPLIEKDIDKLTKLAEDLSGYTFHPVALPAVGPRMDMVMGQSLVLAEVDREWRAYSAVCPHPECGQLLSYLAHLKELKCFSCERSYSLHRGTSLTRLPLRKEKKRTLVGIPGGGGL